MDEQPMTQLGSMENVAKAKSIGLVGGTLANRPSSPGPLSDALSRLAGSIDHADQAINNLIGQTKDFHKVPHSLMHEAKQAQTALNGDTLDEPRSTARQVVDAATLRVNQLARKVEELTELIEV